MESVWSNLYKAILVFFMNDLTANKTQVMCLGCGLGHIWIRYIHPNYIAEILSTFQSYVWEGRLCRHHTTSSMVIKSVKFETYERYIPIKCILMDIGHIRDLLSIITLSSSNFAAFWSFNLRKSLVRMNVLNSSWL